MTLPPLNNLSLFATTAEPETTTQARVVRSARSYTETLQHRRRRLVCLCGHGGLEHRALSCMITECSCLEFRRAAHQPQNQNEQEEEAT
jgi:hypothetical protein